MRIVSENSEEDLARMRAEELLRYPLRQLASNLMRVVRGAGKPYEVGIQAAAVIDVFENYKSVVGYYPSSGEIQEALSIDQEHWDEFTLAQATIVAGSLQIAASELAHQPTQVARGSRELFEGIQHIERLRERNRRQVSAPRKKPRKKTP
ncbi:hypothetical protein [Qipengyuania oceanensis]|uniref:Uncharacterized protein n=1 Tax=Qipengyuania oceanensis TaxID=1463597 RepID=A0A844YKG0_9SPHN|nr:hypothetical protein [Qipengyuania oceanensis]MXO63424.1 hypothetical protein [Qipengyuania oceanensis]